MSDEPLHLAYIFWHVTLIYSDKTKLQQCFICAKAKRQQQQMFFVRKRSGSNNNVYLRESEAAATTMFI
ncbi:hypothetical protein AN161_20695 [Lysinibacillus sp. FJAT-14222]|nr:hypothetical protein AN161_20695 [Lysinibacillus sp. FJAT-14222]